MTTTGRQSPRAVGAIHNLTRSYLQKPRTIVLAVVSATSDFQVQSIGDLMRDPEVAQRMMGVITKPDGVLSNDDSKDYRIDLQPGSATRTWLARGQEFLSRRGRPLSEVQRP